MQLEHLRVLEEVSKHPNSLLFKLFDDMQINTDVYSISPSLGDNFAPDNDRLPTLSQPWSDDISFDLSFLFRPFTALLEAWLQAQNQSILFSFQWKDGKGSIRLHSMLNNFLSHVEQKEFSSLV